MTIEELAVMVRSAKGLAKQFQFTEVAIAGEVEDKFKALGLRALRDGRMVTAWDTQVIDYGRAIVTEDPWVGPIKMWLGAPERNGRVSRDVSALEVAQRVFELALPTRKEITRIAKCLKSMGFVNVRIGTQRLSSWRAPAGFVFGNKGAARS